MKTLRGATEEGQLVLYLFDEDILLRKFEDVKVFWTEPAMKQPGLLGIVQLEQHTEVLYLDVDGEPVDAPLVRHIEQRVEELTKD